MDQMWRAIENIIDSDMAYEEFRSRTKRFMVANPMTCNEFSINAGISATIFIAFIKKGYRRLSIKTISKILNYMEDYKSRS